MRRLRWWCCLALLVPALALARGGGGSHYSGGHSSASHSSSGGHYSGSGSSGYGYGGGYYGGGGTPLSGSGLCLGICLVVAYLVIRYYLQQRETRSVQQAFDDAETEQRTTATDAEVARWVQALQKSDPTFELEPFLGRCRAVFMKLQDGWFRRNLADVRPFLSDATFERFDLQLRLMHEEGIRNAITDIEVMDLGLIGLAQNASFDTAHVRVHARMRDTDVRAAASDQEALESARHASSEPFVEVWSFVRRPGAKTKPGEDVLNGKCPSCGAPFKGGAANNCTYCGAIVNSGHYDWVLAEITQGIEYEDAEGAAPGVEELRGVDPALSVEVLEDRASLIFWRWIDAQTHNDAGQIRKYSTATLVGSLDQDLTALKAQGKRRFFKECAVGAVTLRGIGPGDPGFDRADLEIRWSARLGLGTSDGARPGSPTSPQRWVFTLGRKQGALTSPKTGMSTNRCPSCNAPLIRSSSPTCEYCGAQLTDGERDWVLVRAVPIEQWDGQRAAPGDSAELISDQSERERLVYMMAAVAAADGNIDPKERKLLKELSARWGVPYANVELAAQSPEAQFNLFLTNGPEAGESFLRSLVQMAMTDGKIDRTERRMLETAARKFGLSERLDTLISEAAQ